MKTETPPATNGSKLLEALAYDRRLCGALIAVRPDWKALLESIPQSHIRRGVADIVSNVRLALGLNEHEYAERIARGDPS
jgi:hypothetical protein